MNENQITIAIRRQKSAEALAEELKKNGIAATTSLVQVDNNDIDDATRVIIDNSNLIKALAIIEEWEDQNQKEEQTDEEPQKSKKKKIILIPVDFSEHSIKACEIGFKLAEIFQLEAHIIHAFYITTALYDISASPMHEAELYRCTEDITHKFEDLEKIIKEKIATGVWPNVPYIAKSEEGLPENIIRSYSKRHKPAVIVMATRPKEEKEQDISGNITSEIADNANAPVLIITEQTKLFLEDKKLKVIFATNFDKGVLNSLERMMLLLNKFKLKLFLIHISVENDRWDEIKLIGIKNYFAEHYSKGDCEYKIIRGDDVINEIEKQTDLLDADLVVVNSKKRNIFAKLFNPSIARRMILDANIPMLVFHIK